jgi:ankyrin repeat protein
MDLNTKTIETKLNADILISVDDREYLINVIGGCYETFESNGTFYTCVCIEPYKSLTERVLGFHATDDISILSNEDVQRASSWYLDNWINIQKNINRTRDMSSNNLTDLFLTQTTYNELFRCACKQNQLKIVQYLHNEDFVDMYDHELHGFHIACNYSSLDVVRWLYSCVKHPVDDVLLYACSHDNLELVKLLCAADYNIHDSKNFSAACHRGSNNVLRWMLFEAKYIADKTDCGDFTMICGAYMYAKTVRVLLEYGVDVHQRGELALENACRNSHIEIAKLLVEYGANIHSVVRLLDPRYVGISYNMRNWIRYAVDAKSRLQM